MAGNKSNRILIFKNSYRTISFYMKHVQKSKLSTIIGFNNDLRDYMYITNLKTELT